MSMSLQCRFQHYYNVYFDKIMVPDSTFTRHIDIVSIYFRQIISHWAVRWAPRFRVSRFDGTSHLLDCPESTETKQKLERERVTSVPQQKCRVLTTVVHAAALRRLLSHAYQSQARQCQAAAGSSRQQQTAAGSSPRTAGVWPTRTVGQTG